MKRTVMFLCLSLLFLLGCTKIFTQVDNTNEYDAIPLEHGFITFKDNGSASGRYFRKLPRKAFIMGEYHIVKTARTNSKIRVGGGSRSKVSGSYEFYRGDTRLGWFDVSSITLGISPIGGLTIGVKNERVIHIKNERGETTDWIEMGVPARGAYTFIKHKDNDLGDVVVKTYFKNTTNMKEDAFGAPVTGLTIKINDEEYGILALLPKPVLHKKHSFNKSLEETHGDKIIFYVLMALEAFFKDEEAMRSGV